jgi:hypothetical protein
LKFGFFMCADPVAWYRAGKKNPLYTQCLVLQVDKLCRDMPNKAAAELDRLHDRTVNPVFASYERTSEAIRAKCRHTLAAPPPLFTR